MKTNQQTNLEHRQNILNHILIVTLLTLLMCSPGVALARNPACSDLGAGIIFKDSMYGMLLGAIGTGLYVLASDSHKKSGQQIAAGSLIGLGLGAGVGVVETSVRDCDTRIAKQEKRSPGWQAPSMIVEKEKRLSNENVHTAPSSVGLQLAYRLP